MPETKRHHKEAAVKRYYQKRYGDGHADPEYEALLRENLRKCIDSVSEGQNGEGKITMEEGKRGY